MNMISKTMIKEKMKDITQPWSPIEVARVNDWVVRMALFKGEYHWHAHEKEDELFYVVKGDLRFR